MVRPIEVQVGFTRAPFPSQNSRLVIAYVQPQPDIGLEEHAIEQIVLKRLAAELAGKEKNVTPLVSLTLLENVGHVHASAAGSSPRRR